MEKLKFLYLSDTQKQKFSSEFTYLRRKLQTEHGDALLYDLLVLYHLVKTECKYFLEFSGFSYMEGTNLAKQLKQYKESIRNVFVFLKSQKEDERRPIIDIIKEWSNKLLKEQIDQKNFVRKLKRVAPFDKQTGPLNSSAKALMKEIFSNVCNPNVYRDTDAYKPEKYTNMFVINKELQNRRVYETLSELNEERKRKRNSFDDNHYMERLKRITPTAALLEDKINEAKKLQKVLDEISANKDNILYRKRYYMVYQMLKSKKCLDMIDLGDKLTQYQKSIRRTACSSNNSSSSP